MLHVADMKMNTWTPVWTFKLALLVPLTLAISDTFFMHEDDFPAILHPSRMKLHENKEWDGKIEILLSIMSPESDGPRAVAIIVSVLELYFASLGL